MRRFGAMWVLLTGLAGCDQGLRAEVAALREEVAAQAATQRTLRARIDQLEEDLAREREARREGDAQREAPPPGPSATAEPAAPTPTLTASCAGGTCTLQRAEIEALFAEPAAFARAARVVPMMKDGKVVGFKLFGIRPSSPFAAIGLQNGDTVHEIGGIQLTSVEVAIDAYAALKKLDRWVIRGTRKDAPLELVLEIR